MALKGFNATSYWSVSEAVNNIETMRSLGGDSVRWQFNVPFYELLLDRAAYVLWLQAEIEKMLEVVNLVNGMKFIADLHSPFGGVVGNRLWYLQNADTEALFLEDIARVCDGVAGYSKVIGVDMINEPAAPTAVWRNFIQKYREVLRTLTQKKLWVSSTYGNIVTLGDLPRLGRNYRLTCHYWPPVALKGAPGHEYVGDMSEIKDGSFLNKLVRTDMNGVLLGEIGCTKFVGADNQKVYMRKALRHCVSNNIDVMVHGLFESHVWGYEETGAINVIKQEYSR